MDVYLSCVYHLQVQFNYSLCAQFVFTMHKLRQSCQTEREHISLYIMRILILFSCRPIHIFRISLIFIYLLLILILHRFFLHYEIQNTFTSSGCKIIPIKPSEKITG